jgi:PAS domain S-box-containing protein
MSASENAPAGLCQVGPAKVPTDINEPGLRPAPATGLVPHNQHPPSAPSTLPKAVEDREQIEAELRRAKEEWERTFDAVPDLIAILDDQHRIVRVNQAMARSLGLPADQCVGRFCYEVVHGTHGPRSGCPHTDALADGRKHQCALCEPRLGGDFLVTITPLKNEAGQQIGSVHVARDITARKRMEKALAQANLELLEKNKELTRFNRAMVGRELRMMELKREVNTLCAKAGLPPPYRLDFDKLRP